MPLFPAFVDLSAKKVLVVGGGKVATRKVRSLLKFTNNITVVAPKVTDEIERLAEEGRIRLKRRRFLASDLKGIFMVVVAVDRESLQRRIYRLCERRKILCNAVDSPEWCSFIFPSLVVRGDLVIGITSGGKAPAVSRRTRELVERCLPENIEEVLRRVADLRKRIPKGEDRRRKMIDLVEDLLPFE